MNEKIFHYTKTEKCHKIQLVLFIFSILSNPNRPRKKFICVSLNLKQIIEVTELTHLREYHARHKKSGNWSRILGTLAPELSTVPFLFAYSFLPRSRFNQQFSSKVRFGYLLTRRAFCFSSHSAFGFQERKVLGVFVKPYMAMCDIFIVLSHNSEPICILILLHV